MTAWIASSCMPLRGGSTTTTSGRSPRDASIFAGPLMEIMRHSNLGVNGHIALQTDDVEAAMEDLASRGITFRPEFVRRDESGKVYFAYLDQEFGGFAFHLTT